MWGELEGEAVTPTPPTAAAEQSGGQEGGLGCWGGRWGPLGAAGASVPWQWEPQGGFSKGETLSASCFEKMMPTVLRRMASEREDRTGGRLETAPVQV